MVKIDSTAMAKVGSQLCSEERLFWTSIKENYQCLKIAYVRYLPVVGVQGGKSLSNRSATVPTEDAKQ